MNAVEQLLAMAAMMIKRIGDASRDFVMMFGFCEAESDEEAETMIPAKIEHASSSS